MRLVRAPTKSRWIFGRKEEDGDKYNDVEEGTCKYISFYSPLASSSNPVLTGWHSPMTEVIPMPKTAAAASTVLSCIFCSCIFSARLEI